MSNKKLENQWSEATVKLSDIIMQVMLEVGAQNISEVLPKIKELKNKVGE